MHGRMTRSRDSVKINAGSNKSRNILLMATLLLAAAVVVLFVMYSRAGAFKRNTQAQLKRYVDSALTDAIENVNRLGSSVQSDSAVRLSMVRQNVYLIDKLNNISITLSGRGAAQVSGEDLSVLYDDLSVYERLLQTATASTLEARTNLLTHLVAVKVNRTAK